MRVALLSLLLRLVPVLIFIRLLGAVNHLLLVPFICSSKAKYPKITEPTHFSGSGMLTGDANSKKKGG